MVLMLDKIKDGLEILKLQSEKDKEDFRLLQEYLVWAGFICSVIFFEIMCAVDNMAMISLYTYFCGYFGFVIVLFFIIIDIIL